MNQSNKHLRALTIVGRTLTLMPLIMGFPIFIYSAVTGNSFITTADAGRNLAITSGIMFLCGLVALIYVGIKRFQEGKRGTEESEKR